MDDNSAQSYLQDYLKKPVNTDTDNGTIFRHASDKNSDDNNSEQKTEENSGIKLLPNKTEDFTEKKEEASRDNHHPGDVEDGKKMFKPFLIGGAILGFVALTIFGSVFLLKKNRFVGPFKATKGKETAILLGRVVNVSSRFGSCPNQRFVYGNNCGVDECHGGSDYKVVWSQGEKTDSTVNNDCSGEDGPRYTFEKSSLTNPLGDDDGEEVEIKLEAGEGVRLARWYHITTDSNNQPMPGTLQEGTFENPGPVQTLKIKVFASGDYKWNHLWFYALDPEVTPTLTPTPVLTVTPLPTGTGTITPTFAPTSTPVPGVLSCVRLVATPAPDNKKPGDSLTFNCYAGKEVGVVRFEFRVAVDGNVPVALPTATPVLEGNLYVGRVTYRIPSYGCYKVECRACSESKCTEWGQVR